MREAVRLSRRSLLATGAAAATLPFASAAQAQSEPLRIGAVLPIAGAALPSARINLRSVGEAARMGLILGEEDAARNGELVGWTTVVTISNAPGVDAAARAARRLVEREKVSVIIGGFGREEAETLAGIAEESGSLFLNIAATCDSLRRACHANTFHVEASAAMYLDAIFGWFVRAGFRRWYFVHDDGADSQALYERAPESLRDGHWGAEAAGRGMLRQDDSRDFAPVIADVGAAGPDVVLLLTDWVTQLDFLSRYEVSGLTQAVTGFPDAAAQMREFYFASRQAAPVAGSGHRAALWEATLDAYGSRELNARFDGRWGKPMDPLAWSAYQAVKVAFGGATVAVIQGTIPLALAPLLGIRLGPVDLLLAWAIMFAMGVAITAVGVIIATRMRTFEGFGSISNGVIQPLYFLSGAIFPLRGIVGGVGFLDIPQGLRDELSRHGIYAIGGGWVVDLPDWLKLLVYANPVSYMLDLLRRVVLDFSQLPMAANLLAILALPPLAVVLAAYAMASLRRA